MKTFAVFFVVMLMMVIRSLAMMTVWNMVVCRSIHNAEPLNIVQSLVAVVSFSIISCKISFKGAKVAER